MAAAEKDRKSPPPPSANPARAIRRGRGAGRRGARRLRRRRSFRVVTPPPQIRIRAALCWRAPAQFSGPEGGERRLTHPRCSSSFERGAGRWCSLSEPEGRNPRPRGVPPPSPSPSLSRPHQMGTIHGLGTIWTLPRRRSACVRPVAVDVGFAAQSHMVSPPCCFLFYLVDGRRALWANHLLPAAAQLKGCDAIVSAMIALVSPFMSGGCDRRREWADGPVYPHAATSWQRRVRVEGDLASSPVRRQMSMGRRVGRGDACAHVSFCWQGDTGGTAIYTANRQFRRRGTRTPLHRRSLVGRVGSLKQGRLSPARLACRGRQAVAQCPSRGTAAQRGPARRVTAATTATRTRGGACPDNSVGGGGRRAGVGDPFSVDGRRRARGCHERRVPAAGSGSARPSSTPAWRHWLLLQ